MTFTHDDADLSRVIRKYIREGYNYHVEYLDNSIDNYVCYDECEELNIVNIMIEQALERQEKMSMESLAEVKNMSTMASLLGAFSSGVFFKNGKQGLALLSFIALTAGISTSKSKTKMLKELKKYQMFLNVISDIPYNELEEKWIEYIKTDKLYTQPFDINHLDNHSYSTVKSFYKKLNSNKKVMSSN